MRWMLICVTAGALLIAGCGATHGADKHERASGQSTLGGCVATWNEASLGDGKEALRGTASKAATLVRSRDGVCMLMPSRQTPSESGAVYMSLLGGDYSLSSPVNGYGSKNPAPNLRELLSAVTGKPNVRVNVKTGTVAAESGRPIRTVPYTMLDGANACKSVDTPPTTRRALPTSYKVVANSASCSRARVLIFAYVKGEGDQTGSIGKMPVRTIAGWRCSARTLAKRSVRLQCTNGPAHVVARSVSPKVIGQSSALEER